MTEQDTKETNERGRGPFFIAGVVLSLPLLYVLSIGPVALLMEKTNGMHGLIPNTALLKFYWPVVWLHNHTFLRHPLELYLQLWGVK